MDPVGDQRSSSFGEAVHRSRQLSPSFSTEWDTDNRDLFEKLSPRARQLSPIFLWAEDLPRGEDSYRQFGERRAPGEGSYRRFLGRGFTERGGQLSPIFGEACPGEGSYRRFCLAENLPRGGEGSYRQFLERRAHLPSLPLARAGFERNLFLLASRSSKAQEQICDFLESRALGERSYR